MGQASNYLGEGIENTIMNTAGLMLLALTFALGCRREKPALAPTCCGAEETTRDAASSPPDGAAPISCAHFAPQDEAPAQFEEGKRLIESCGEQCMKSEEGGNERSRGLEILKRAALSGHLEAQSLYGRTLFGDLMTTDSEVELAAEYVEALYFLALSAQRGDSNVRDNLPQLVDLRVDAVGALSEELSAPLSGLEEQWVKDAVRRAQTDVVCFGE